MKATLAALLATVLAGLAPGSTWAEMDRWKGPDSQRCAVVDCSSPRPEFEPRSEDSEDTEPTETTSERYDRIHKDAIRVWNLAATYRSSNAKMDAYSHLLDLFRQQQAIQDGPKVRDAIAQVEAMIAWTSGVLDAEKGDFASAVGEMMAAYQKRPD